MCHLKYAVLLLQFDMQYLAFDCNSPIQVMLMMPYGAFKKEERGFGEKTLLALVLESHRSVRKFSGREWGVQISKLVGDKNMR